MIPPQTAQSAASSPRGGVFPKGKRDVGDAVPYKRTGGYEVCEKTDERTPKRW